MIKHAILGTDFSKAVNEIIANSRFLNTLGIEKITLVHVLNLRDVIMVEQFTLEGLEKKLEDQKNLLIKKGFEVDPAQVFLDEKGDEYFRHEGFFPEEELVKVLKNKGVN